MTWLLNTTPRKFSWNWTENSIFNCPWNSTNYALHMKPKTNLLKEVVTNVQASGWEESKRRKKETEKKSWPAPHEEILNKGTPCLCWTYTQPPFLGDGSIRCACISLFLSHMFSHTHSHLNLQLPIAKLEWCSSGQSHKTTSILHNNIQRSLMSPSVRTGIWLCLKKKSPLHLQRCA